MRAYREVLVSCNVAYECSAVAILTSFAGTDFVSMAEGSDLFHVGTPCKRYRLAPPPATYVR